MSKITLIKGQESINRTKELLGPVWSMNSTENSYPKKQGPFMFSGEDSTISLHITQVIESCQERLLISTQNLSDASVHRCNH